MILESGDIEKFRALIARLLGLQFGDDKLEFLKDVLRQRMAKGGHDFSAAYLHTLFEPGLSHEELGHLAEALTVPETFFFRNYDQFRALIEIVLPARIKARSASRNLRILSAGCASGEEAYALAMVLVDAFPDLNGWDIKISGADINPAMLAKAKKGLYSSWSLRDTQPEMLAKFFQAEGKDFQVREDIRAMVTFEARNFAHANADLWEAGAFDVIFCRNMIMYLNSETTVALVARMARALAPEAFLFLGYAETLRGLSSDFHLCHTHGTFYYQRLPEHKRTPAAKTASEMPSARVATLPEDTLPPLDRAAPWVEPILGASQPIANLAARSGAALESALRPPPNPDVATLLLRATLQINSGKLSDAEASCRVLLQADDLNAGAHYILALCREQAGDLAGAQEQDRQAVYLDAAFAMPWLHLGLMARREGNADLVSHYLQQALILLDREDASRLLLFDGGFGREGLIQLCKNGLRTKEEVR